MARRMSFAKTIAQIRARKKTETRRLKWNFLKAGDELQAVTKTMGFKKGERAEHLANIRVIKTWREPLNRIDRAGVVAEGFPEMSVEQFILFFCLINNCEPDVDVRVIRFEYLEENN
jgi:hypothetical protein